MTSQEITIVQKWHHAVNKSDKEKLSALVTENVKVSGPRGSVSGVHSMLAWVERAKVTLTPQRYFQQNEVVAVEELGAWHDPETGEVRSKQVVTTVFTLEDGLISGISRYDTLKEAFEAAGLKEMKEVKS